MSESPGTVPDRADPSRLQSEMEFISELCAVVAGTSELQPILDWIVSKTARLLDADECGIRLLTADQAGAQTMVVDQRRAGPEAGAASWPVALKMTVTGYLLLPAGGELSSADMTADPRFPGLRGLSTRVRALLAVPLRVDGRVTGMLAVSEVEAGRRWTRADAQLLGIVASHSAGVIEKARLRAEAEQKQRLEIEKRRMEKDLLVARELQMKLVPAAPLDTGPWRADGRVVPAQQVGGDYYDYFALGDGRLVLAIADVSGKGVPAALLVSTVQGTLRAVCDGRRRPVEVVREINQAVARSAGAGRFVTFFLAELDAASGRMSYVNAGHNWPLLRRADGALERLETGGPPLGLFEGVEFGEGDVAFGPRDALLAFSDGISEAVDVHRAEFGDERIERMWSDHAGDGPAAFIERLLRSVAEFRGAAAQSDDMTALVLARREG